ncbi:MMPL family transporter [Planosporangium thailandense]|uniref:MMPL family transporter n=1 Tax=Planosporangium thailandense TaxID=765197 RepID=A0ABX0XUH3_9ACTN|nr:MMPL family transporter [Planosporangium thailandense]NJC69658.1 MMPL family transporter [Planosporangium thailandense]
MALDSGATAPRRLRWLLPALAIIAFLLVGWPLGSLAGKVNEVQRNDTAEYLPASAEATVVQQQIRRFAGRDTMPAIIVYSRPSGLTPADRQKIASDVRAVSDRLGGKLAASPLGPVPSADGQAAQVLVQFAGSDARKLQADIRWIRARVDDTPGLRAHVGGPGGIMADLMSVFDGINGMLLVVTAGIVLVILVFVYRSPILPFVVLGVAGISLGMSNGLVYLLAKNDILTVSGQTQAILDVLVVGAGTDYALLLVSRFREELRRHASRYDAVRTAWRASVEPIVASASTVILGLLCMLVSDLKSTRGLGPVAAIGIGCALLCMLVLLPAALALCGRVAFWPFLPRFGARPAEEHGVWARIAGLVGARPRTVWVATALLLVAFAAGLFRLQSNGIPQTAQFLGNPDSKVAQTDIGRHFPAGDGSPAIVIARADTLRDVVRTAQSVPGVARAVPYAPTPPPGATPPIATPLPKIVDGRVRVDVTLAVPADSDRAGDVVRALRAKLHALPGADAEVGGFTAINLDVQTTAQRDRNLVIPLVLAVVFVVLMLLLRAVVAPLLLIVTVILSFFATLGVSGVVFRDVLGFAGADSSFPLFAFVFLVALGVDYNIFLMTRVREEAARRGHRPGTLAGLSVTGGVITSAGVVLAATFGALSVLPLVFVAEIAFTVAFGVLLDTLVVRSLMVPALTVDVGPVVWWPGRLWRWVESETRAVPGRKLQGTGPLNS